MKWMLQNSCLKFCFEVVTTGSFMKALRAWSTTRGQPHQTPDLWTIWCQRGCDVSCSCELSSSEFFLNLHPTQSCNTNLIPVPRGTPAISPPLPVWTKAHLSGAERCDEVPKHVCALLIEVRGHLWLSSNLRARVKLPLGLQIKKKISCEFLSLHLNVTNQSNINIMQITKRHTWKSFSYTHF